MLPGVTLPASLAALVGALRPCFTAPGFVTFCGLAAGLAGQVRRRTVVGMLLGGCLQHVWPHDRRAAQPWYRTKHEPAFEDMVIKLRRTMIAARISAARTAQPTPGQIRAVLAAWDAAAA